MKFYKVLKNNAPVNHYAVYVEINYQEEHYICDYIGEDTPEAKVVNELGLTLRSRLVRSKGKYAMLEGTIFNPCRLAKIIIDLKSFDFKSFKGSEYKSGHTLLTVEADGYINKYLIYDDRTVSDLKEDLNNLKA